MKFTVQNTIKVIAACAVCTLATASFSTEPPATAATTASTTASTIAPAAAPSMANAQASNTLSSGEVKKIDRDAQKITLKHGEIKSLDMPPMTMVFRVADPAFLDKVKATDKVKFSVEKRDGALVLTTIETAP